MTSRHHDQSRRGPMLSRLNQLDAEIRWVEDFAEVVTLGADRAASDRFEFDPEQQADALSILRRLQEERARLLAALGWLPMDGCCPCRECGSAVEPELLLSNPATALCARCGVPMPD